uniref:Cytidyltransferase-like domain-containing protein n=1 Tax=Dunaliella tertiolecta TaxID=3047 RepID=A0A7S3QL21_DUNTE|mmetsp:Transcript_12801/g.34914  ORF Transcript_12801/g.34914 Transcript_12801/m.34914 type:complete len:468 (-) Transcript_12801:8-1411(-)
MAQAHLFRKGLAAWAQKPYLLRNRSLASISKQKRSIMPEAAAHQSGLDSTSAQLVHSINASNVRLVLYATGGPIQVPTWLLSTASGLNQTAVLEVLLPQTQGSLVDLTKQVLPWCSEAAALTLAQVAHRRAAHLAAFGTPIVGVSICMDPAAPQGHRAFVAVHGKIQGPCVACIQLTQPGASRHEEDTVISRLVLKVLADALDAWPRSLQGQSKTLAPQGWAPSEQLCVSQPLDSEGIPAAVSLKQIAAPDPLEALMAGNVKCVEFNGSQVVTDAPRRNKLYLPGSFNPLHAGHKQLLAVARSLSGDKEAAFELSIGNPDKGMLPVEETRRRVQQFVDAQLPVVVSCAPLFPDKSDMFPDSTFVLGYDTAKRLVMPKYYGDSELNMLLNFARLRHRGCKFMVAGRYDAEAKKFLTLRDVQVPLGLADLFEDIDEHDFRVDVSSTELRAQAMRQEPLGARPSGASRVE